MRSTIGIGLFSCGQSLLFEENNETYSLYTLYTKPPAELRYSLGGQCFEIGLFSCGQSLLFELNARLIRSILHTKRPADSSYSLDGHYYVRILMVCALMDYRPVLNEKLVLTSWVVVNSV